MTLNYDSDDALNLSPGLTPYKPRSTPSPSPEPLYPKQRYSPDTSPRTGRPRKKKVQPSLGDVVLLTSLEPNRPDIAQRAGEATIIDSDGEASDAGNAMEVDDACKPQLNSNDNDRSSGLKMTAERALAMDPATKAQPITSPQRMPAPLRPHPLNIRTGLDATNHRTDGTKPALRSPLELPYASSSRNMSSTEAHSTAATAPHHLPLHPAMSIRSGGCSFSGEPLSNLQIPDREGRSSQKLPALQSPHSPVDTPGSPKKVVLPGMDEMLKVADVGNVSHQENGFPTPLNGYAPTQRHSISSPSAAMSPTSSSQPYSNGSTVHRRSSASQYPPYNHVSPISSQSEAGTSPYDPYVKSPHVLSTPSGIPLDSQFFARRTSQVSENERSYSHSLPSASSASADTCGSSETYSPTAKVDVRERDRNRMSIDGATLAGTPSSMTLAGTPGSVTTGTPGSGGGTTLPSIAQAMPSIQHIQTVPPHGTGSFQCDYLGCNAAPFQTQYLLNSHANVHSQNRPHFCPVPGCARGEGGKGFKRKNEMIRHGLVHDSPGYVCPFCPDQEHKYPRPDNLQRHVRVHHSERNKDDPALREVLLQRPEGGPRGRRRRTGGSQEQEGP